MVGFLLRRHATYRHAAHTCVAFLPCVKLLLTAMENTRCAASTMDWRLRPAAICWILLLPFSSVTSLDSLYLQLRLRARPLRVSPGRRCEGRRARFAHDLSNQSTFEKTASPLRRPFSVSHKLHVVHDDVLVQHAAAIGTARNDAKRDRSRLHRFPAADAEIVHFISTVWTYHHFEL